MDPNRVYIHFRIDGEVFPDAVLWSHMVFDGLEHTLQSFLRCTRPKDLKTPGQVHAYKQLQRILNDVELVSAAENPARPPTLTAVQKFVNRAERKKEQSKVLEVDYVDPTMFDSQETNLTACDIEDDLLELDTDQLDDDDDETRMSGDSYD